MLLERVICSIDRTPMRCTDSSVPVVYNDAVVYHGTEFTCPECGNVIVAVTSEQSIPAFDFTKPENTLDVKD